MAAASLVPGPVRLRTGAGWSGRATSTVRGIEQLGYTSDCRVREEARQGLCVHCTRMEVGSDVGNAVTVAHRRARRSLWHPGFLGDPEHQ